VVAKWVEELANQALQHMSDLPNANAARPRTLRVIYRHDNVLPMMR